MLNKSWLHRFFKDSSHTEYWGEKKYAGGQGGFSAKSNFPGCHDRASLLIPASSFVFHFRSDVMGSDWGYRITVEAVVGLAEMPSTQPSRARRSSRLIEKEKEIKGLLKKKKADAEAEGGWEDEPDINDKVGRS